MCVCFLFDLLQSGDFYFSGESVQSLVPCLQHAGPLHTPLSFGVSDIMSPGCLPVSLDFPWARGCVLCVQSLATYLSHCTYWRCHAVSGTLWADVPKSVDVSFKLPVGLYNSLASIFICVFLGHCDVSISQSKFVTFPFSRSPFLPTLSISVNEMARPYRHRIIDPFFSSPYQFLATWSLKFLYSRGIFLQSLGCHKSPWPSSVEAPSFLQITSESPWHEACLLMIHFSKLLPRVVF